MCASTSPGKPVLLYIIKYTSVGGSTLHVLQLMRHFSESYEVHLCVGEWGFLAETAKREGYSVAHLPELGVEPGFSGMLRMYSALRRHVREIKPDLVHAHTSLGGVIGRLVCQADTIPCILTVHGWQFVPGSGWFRRLMCWLLEFYAARRSKAHIITVSQYDARIAHRYLCLNDERVTIVHNGIASSVAISNTANKPESPARLLMVARFVPQKDHMLLLEALAGIPVQDWQMLFVGEGETEDLVKQRAMELDLHSRIRFLGIRNDVDQLLGETHIFVLTSKYEGLPLSVIEAMRAGLPVLATRVGGMDELVTQGETGYLHAPGDSATLARHLEQLITDPPLRRRLGLAGRRRFEAQFSEYNMLEQTARIYDDLLQQAR